MPDDTPRTIEANGLDHAVLESGSPGDPLVILLHGFPDTARSWDALRPRLAARGFHVIAPYLRGYAPSGVPPRDTTAEDLGQDVLGLMDALEVSQAHAVVGHDWGAMGAHAAVGMAEERFTRLVTLAIPHPAGFKPGLADLWRARHFLAYKLPGAPSRFAKADFAGLWSIVARWSPTWTVPEGEFDDLLRAFSDPASLDAAFGYYRALAPSPPRFLRKKLSLSTLAIFGEEDGAAPPAAFTQAASRYKGEYTAVGVPGGHFPHRESAERVEALIEEFLAPG